MRQLVHIRAVGAVLAPPQAQPHHHAGTGAAIQAGVADMLAPGIEDAQGITVGNAARGGIVRVQLQQRAFFHALQAGHIRKAAVQEVARRWRDHGQRVGGGRGLVVG